MSPVFLQSPYSVVFAAAYAVWAVPELLDSVRDCGETAAAFDGGSRYGIYAAVAALVGGGFLFATATPWAGFGPLAVPAFALGVAFVLAGTALRWHAVRVLGRQFSRRVAVRRGHEVVASGPYAHVRHPTYTGSLLAMVGLGLAFGTWLSLATAVLAGGAAYAYRIRVEERALSENLDGYEEYREETPYRLVPYLY